MEKKQEDGRFCRAYLRTMDPEQAAAEIGRRDGYAMLGQKGTQQKLERMRCDAAAQLKREDVLRQLARLAFGRVDDAVTLALRRGETEPEGLELSAVSELRVTEKGVEVKLVDRVRALETLWKLLGPANPSRRIRCFRRWRRCRGKRETGMRNDMIRFSRKQRQVLTWWRQNRWQAIICDGAVRSGKTFCMGLSFSCGPRVVLTDGSLPCAARRWGRCGGIC